MLAAVIVVFTLGGVHWDFRVPLGFSSDALVYLAQSKTTFDNGWWWVSPRQAAPSGLDALLFPSNSNIDQALVWLLRWILNSPFTATNFAWLLMVALSAASCTYVARTLQFSRAASVTAGVLFALSPYALYRNIDHFSLVTYLVPFPAALAVHLGMGRVPAWKTNGTFLAGCILLGFNYVYYSFFGCFFLALGAATGYMRTCRMRPLLAGGGSIALIALCTALNLVPSFWVSSREGSPLLVREKVPAEAEVYGLKIRQLVSPVFEHSFPPFGAWTRRESVASYPSETENMVSRLGLAGSLGFLALVGVVVAGPAAQARLLSAGRLAVAGVLLATIGGFGSLFNLLVSPEIRAYNRIAPFIALFAMVAVATGIDALGSRRRLARIVTATLVLVIGAWDQTQALRPLAAAQVSTAEAYENVHQFVSAVEKMVPHGTMVLQVPFTLYLNDSGHARMLPYDHLKPFIVSEHLHWSYPALSNRQFAWQEAASQLQPAELVALAAGAGFGLIWVDRFGYPDGGDSTLAGLKAVAGTRTLLDNGQYVAVDIADVARTLTSVAGQTVADFVADKPVTQMQMSCGGAPTVGVERIGQVRLPNISEPTEIALSRDAEVAGWAVTPESERQGADVEVVVDNIPFAAAYGFDRPDVAASFQVPAAQPSGFRAMIPAYTLRPGQHQLTLRVQSRMRPCFYESQGIPLVVD
jgi:phosphoglycerol transferase